MTIMGPIFSFIWSIETPFLCKQFAQAGQVSMLGAYHTDSNKPLTFAIVAQAIGPNKSQGFSSYYYTGESFMALYQTMGD